MAQQRSFILVPLEILVLFSLCISIAAQRQESGLQQAKVNLENFQKELFALDKKQQLDVERLEKQIAEKGEFETTKQFEERERSTQKKANDLQFQIQMKDGAERDRLFQQMNEILRTDFPVELDLTLGRYDADTGRFGVFAKNGAKCGYLAIPVSAAPKFKDAFSRARVQGKVGLTLDANNKAQEYVITAQVMLDEKTYPVTPEPFTEQQAMELLFGNYQKTEGAEKETSKWKRFDVGSEETELETQDAQAVLFKPFQEGGAEKYLLVAESSCWRPSIAVFKKSAGVWRLEMALKDGGSIQRCGGAILAYQLVKLGPDKPALKIVHGNGRAAASEGEIYWRLDGKFPRQILNLWTYQDYDEDWSVGDRISFRSTVTVLPKSNDGFFDIRVTKTGKEIKFLNKRGVMAPFSKTETYIYSDGQYRETSVPKR